MPARTDVLVVGAGPGGATAAYHLAAAGLEVLLVDRARFPRDKVCGDGLTPRAVWAIVAMGIAPTAPGFARIDGVRLHGEDGRTAAVSWGALRSHPPFGLVRKRVELDDLLVRRAVEAGATFRDGLEAVSPLMDGGRVSGGVVRPAGDGADTHASQVLARFVVAADGAAARFAGGAGVRRDAAGPVAVAARRYYRSPARHEPMFETFLALEDRGRLLPGYGWIFPMGDGELNVGAFVLRGRQDREQVSARQAFDLFVRRMEPRWGLAEEDAVGPVRSGPIPSGANRSPLAVPGLVVVGDAAGLANPLSGEGIGYAMESGELAASVIVGALGASDPAAALRYPAMLRDRFGRGLGAGRRAVRFVTKGTIARPAARAALAYGPLARVGLRAMMDVEDGGSGTAGGWAARAVLTVGSLRARVPAG